MSRVDLCRLATVSIAAGAAIALMWAVAPGAQASPSGGTSSPTIGEYDRTLAPPDSPAQQAKLAAKEGQVKAYFAAHPMASSSTASATTTMTTASSGVLHVSFMTQQDPTWCGPTSLAIILGYKGWGWGGTAWQQQTAAANLLGEPRNGPGTPWVGPDNVPIGIWTSQYPMQDALDYQQYQHVQGIWWEAQQVAGTPSGTDRTNYTNNLVYDVAHGYPFADNEYAAPGYNLQKQPSNIWIMHWFASNGYASSGASNYFSDPGWGGGTQSVDTTYRVVTAIGGRGYVW